ncbi:MAG TPA: radical SAM protein, partial [Thermoanaerobaculia bacterium]
LYTGRGCRSFCSFCLWPQTIGGHRYRTRSPVNVEAEIASAKQRIAGVKEWFFDDDTFTDDEPRARDIARRLGRLGVTWSCNAKPIVSRDTLAEMKDNGLRLLLVGYESGNQGILNNIRKGVRLDIARRFSDDCRRLGILIHGTFIVGLPGETPETIEETVRFAREINPHTIQVSLAAPYRGTELHRQAVANGWLSEEGGRLVGEDGIQVSTLSYPHLSSAEIAQAMERFYRRFYLRPRKIAEMVREMAVTPGMTRRRLREGAEFFRFLSERRAQA